MLLITIFPVYIIIMYRPKNNDKVPFEHEIFGVSHWQESWYEFRVMAVMDDLISESSNVVGVSSTGLFLHKVNTEIFNPSYKIVLPLNSPISPPRLHHQIPSPRSCLMRGWRGLWWRVSWQLSVSWQRQYCSAL